MTHEDGRHIGEIAMNAIAFAEEDHPECELLTVTVTLIVRDQKKRLQIVHADGT